MTTKNRKARLERLECAAAARPNGTSIRQFLLAHPAFRPHRAPSAFAL